MHDIRAALHRFFDRHAAHGVTVVAEIKDQARALHLDGHQDGRQGRLGDDAAVDADLDDVGFLEVKDLAGLHAPVGGADHDGEGATAAHGHEALVEAGTAWATLY